jgi:hypothetical protein
MIRGPRPLRDHVATVAAFLNDYRIEIDSEKQRLKSVKFTSYLLTTCWPKMVRRIQSWQAMGFIFLLSNLAVSNIQMEGQQWNGFPLTVGKGDRTLGAFLNALNNLNKTSIKDVILDHCPNTELSDFSLIFNIVKVAGTGSSESLAPIFSKETILQFHYLAIAAFNGFATSFIRLNEENSKLVGIDY